MFELFCKVKTDSEDYLVREGVAGEYIAEHYHLNRIERWFKGVYKVTVNNERTVFSCECGMFEHSCMPCCHALRVMVHLGVREIPESMIMRRWTKKARSVVPEHLMEYNRDNPALLTQTYSHSSLFIVALEFFKMGDSNVEAFRLAMVILADGKQRLAEVSKVKDGLSLADAGNVAGGNSLGSVDNGAGCSPIVGDNFPLRAPKKKRERGRPTNSRDKPAYEQATKRPRYCSTCHTTGHTTEYCS
uniref:SWIM-type domain-containing protein n=1 Tax=Arundo donax TaxID=35708 RepID=A0A0A9DAR6_ARUDO